MRRTRVMVVDDSAVIRRMLSDVLGEDPELEVIAVGSGAAALARLADAAPDVITLDVEMPGMSGLDALVEIRKVSELPIIMFSASTQWAAAVTLDALARGATDYVTKPGNAGSSAASAELVRTQLVPKIKGLARPVLRVAQTQPPRRSLSLPVDQRIELVVIGSSTGGPNALTEVLRALPASFPVPIAIVQHMPPVFTRLLAERLTAASELAVHEASDGELLAPRQVVIAPGDQHMRLVRDPAGVKVVLDRGPQENSCRPSVDVTLRAAAEIYGRAALAVVLTGMGHDGLRGCQAIKAAGGRVIAQDEASSVVWGMPGAVAGIADHVAPLTDIARLVLRRVEPTAQGRLHAG